MVHARRGYNVLKAAVDFAAGSAGHSETSWLSAGGSLSVVATPLSVRHRSIMLRKAGAGLCIVGGSCRVFLIAGSNMSVLEVQAERRPNPGGNTFTEIGGRRDISGYRVLVVGWLHLAGIQREC